MINLTSNQQFIVALVVAFLTALVPLIPLAIKFLFQANEQKITNAKLKMDRFKETIENLCVAAESLFKEGNGQAKYDWVISKLSDKSLISEAQLKGLIESILLTAKQAFGEEWEKLGAPETPLSPQPAEPSETINYKAPIAPTRDI